VLRSRSSPGHSSSNSRNRITQTPGGAEYTPRFRGPALSIGLGSRAKCGPTAKNQLSASISCSSTATDRYRFRLCPIRLAPFLAGHSPIPPRAAVSADLGFILIAISAERVVIICIPHRSHLDSSTCQKPIRLTSRVRPAPGSLSASAASLLSHPFFSLWLRGLPENADRGNVRVELNGRRQQTDFVVAEDANGLRQVNVLAEERTQPGNSHVVAEFAGVRSAPFEIEATAPVP